MAANEDPFPGKRQLRGVTPSNAFIGMATAVATRRLHAPDVVRRVRRKLDSDGVPREPHERQLADLGALLDEARSRDELIDGQWTMVRISSRRAGKFGDEVAAATGRQSCSTLQHAVDRRCTCADSRVLVCGSLHVQACYLKGVDRCFRSTRKVRKPHCAACTLRLNIATSPQLFSMHMFLSCCT